MGSNEVSRMFRLIVLSETCHQKLSRGDRPTPPELAAHPARLRRRLTRRQPRWRLARDETAPDGSGVCLGVGDWVVKEKRDSWAEMFV